MSAAENTLRNLANVALDRRHDRRAFSQEEVDLPKFDGHGVKGVDSKRGVYTWQSQGGYLPESSKFRQSI